MIDWEVALLQVRSEPFPDRQSNLPQSLPPDDTKGLTDFRDGCSSFRSEATVMSTSGKHMQETWLLLEYCDKGSLQVCPHICYMVGAVPTMFTIVFCASLFKEEKFCFLQ